MKPEEININGACYELINAYRMPDGLYLVSFIYADGRWVETMCYPAPPQSIVGVKVGDYPITDYRG